MLEYIYIIIIILSAFNMENEYCKYNDATGRCVLNPDLSAVQDDPMCYKTDKNRCAVKKKKIIKIRRIKKKILKTVLFSNFAFFAKKNENGIKNNKATK